MANLTQRSTISINQNGITINADNIDIGNAHIEGANTIAVDTHAYAMGFTPMFDWMDEATRILETEKDKRQINNIVRSWNYVIPNGRQKNIKVEFEQKDYKKGPNDLFYDNDGNVVDMTFSRIY